MSQRDTGQVVRSCSGDTHDYEYMMSAKLPEGVLRPGGLRLTKRLVDACALAQDALLVDIGCGTGVTVEYLRNMFGFCAVGVDQSEIRLEQGRKRAPDLQLIRAEAEELPFADNSVHGVLAECSLSVMQNASGVLAEMHRILVPGGKLAITDLYVRRRDDISQKCNSAGVGCKSGIMTLAELAGMLEKNGFSAIVWEDQSAFLKEFVASFIMIHGSAEELWRCIATRQGNTQVFNTKNTGLGYFLLVAEKYPIVIR